MLMSDLARVSHSSASHVGHNTAGQPSKAWAADQEVEFASDRKLLCCRQGIVRWLNKVPEGEHLARRDLSPKLKAELRPYFDAAIAELIEENMIVSVPLGKGIAYRRYSGTAPVQPPSPAQTDAVPTLDAVPTVNRPNLTLPRACAECGNQLGTTGKCVACIVQHLERTQHDRRHPFIGTATTSTAYAPRSRATTTRLASSSGPAAQLRFEGRLLLLLLGSGAGPSA